MEYLTDADLQHLHRAGETARVERKRNAVDGQRLREAICAFANDLSGSGQPGVIFVGVEDDGSCANIDVGDELLLRLSHMRNDGLITPFPTFEVRAIDLDGCRAAAIIVQPSSNPPIRFQGRTWVRVGPRRAIASPEEEKRLIEKRRSASLPFDALPVAGATLDDLDLPRFSLEYLPLLISRDTLEQNERSIGQQLQALRLVDAAGTPTATALLMLGISPQTWFPGAVIAWRRVDGVNVEDQTLNDRVLSGTIVDQLRAVDELAAATIERPVELTGDVHRVRPAYPLPAIQQLVRNAVMHRTYEGTAAPVRVTWFSDRVEILSPGAPFGSVTPATLGRPGFTDYRNPTISEALKAYGYVERFGQGIPLARAALSRNGNPPPVFASEPPEAPAWVAVTIGTCR